MITSGGTELASRCLTSRPFQSVAHLTAELHVLLTRCRRPTFGRWSSAEDRSGGVNLIGQEADRSGSSRGSVRHRLAHHPSTPVNDSSPGQRRWSTDVQHRPAGSDELAVYQAVERAVAEAWAPRDKTVAPRMVARALS